jgi:hypothetical protein
MDARLEQFKWDDDPSPSYFSLYFIRFERYMRLRQILVEEAETDPDTNTIVIDTLLTIGGNDLTQRCMEIPNYENLTYGKLKSLLEKAYTCKNIKLNEFKFRKITPEPDEKLKDFVRRLKLAAQQANISDEKVILMQILCSTSSDKIRGKIMTEGTTLQILLDWQEAHDIVSNEMNKDEPAKINMLQTHHLANQHNKLNKSENVNKHNVVTAENDNNIALRTANLCFYCNLSYPHQNGICPAANERCTHCNKLGHRLICCFSRMQLILSRANQLKTGHISKFKQNNAPYQQHQQPKSTNEKQLHSSNNQKPQQQTAARVKHTTSKPTQMPASSNNKKSVQAVSTTESDSETNYECINSDCPCCMSRNMFQITTLCKSTKRKRPVIEVIINNTKVKMLLDTGADLNACNASTYDRMTIKPKLTNSAIRFRN